MTDIEARAFVIQAVADGLRGLMPEPTPPDKLRETAARFVNTIINNYLQCRLLGVEAVGEKAS